MAIDTKGLNPTKTTLTITDYAGEVMVVALPLVGGDDDPCIEHVHGQSAAFASGRSTSVGSIRALMSRTTTTVNTAGLRWGDGPSLQPYEQDR